MRVPTSLASETPMIPGYRWKSNVGLLLWILLKFVAIAFALNAGQETDSNTLVFYVIWLTGTVFLGWGLWAQAVGKGYSGWLALLGILEIVGLIILAVMPDKHPRAAAARNEIDEIQP